MESQRRNITKEIRELEALERNKDWDDLTPMINKCFRRRIKFPDPTTFGYEYAVVIGLPPVQTDMHGTSHMNKYQLPAMFFSIAPTMFMPFDTADDDDYGDVFHYGTLFSGDLPEQYRNGALWSGMNEPYEECSHTDFISAAASRYKEFIRKIFEPTTPAM